MTHLGGLSPVSAEECAAYKKRLHHLLATLSWKRGPVVLASGRTSDFYLDCKQTTLHPEGAFLVGQLVFAHLQRLRQAGVKIEGVGGLTLGADAIAVATSLTSHLAGAPVPAFIIRKEPKSHGTRAWLEGSYNLPGGAQVLIVEDVVTTGGSTRKALERAQESGLKPMAILTLVDRQEGGRENLADLGLPFASLATRADLFELQ